MFLHILLDLRDSAAPLIAWDISEADLAERVVVPYAKRQRVAIGGRIVEANDVARLQIVQTPLSAKTFLAQTKAFAAKGHDDWFRAERGEDVTDAYLDRIAVDEPPVVDPRQVFVVYGRDEKKRAAMFAFLRALDLHPKEWQELVLESGSATPLIADVLRAGFARAAAFVVLLTGDDVAMLREPLRGRDEPAHEVTLLRQARPNVLFEAGMAIGFAERRTVLVQIGRLRPFSDIGGRHLVHLTNDEATRQDLALRLKAAGCAVVMTGSDWRKAGDFSEEES